MTDLLPRTHGLRVTESDGGEAVGNSLRSRLIASYPSVSAASLCALVDMLGEYLVRERRVVIVTGAGCSTESGIPDYRGPTTRGKTRKPVRYRQFVDDVAWRKRYWARAVVGWRDFVRAEPCSAHRGVAALERLGLAPWLITQNVDGLHQRAGQRSLVELHGSLHWVRCLQCALRFPRTTIQARLLERNAFLRDARAEASPDGDAELPRHMFEKFKVVDCERCGGVLKPDVVYFGEKVPEVRVKQAYRWLDQADALLVLGSSLSVFSGYRFALRAAERKIPLAIMNLGPTRADALASIRVDGRLGLVLPVLVEALRGRGVTSSQESF